MVKNTSNLHLEECTGVSTLRHAGVSV